MSALVFLKLFAIFIVVMLGWLAGRARFFGGGEAARALSNTAFYLFAPGLLFRTTARIDFATMPWSTLVAYFGPVVAWLLVIYVYRRSRARHDAGHAPAEPSVRAITATFGNTVQLGIPIAQALFGESGLSIHLAIVSLHALTLLTVLTVLVELDLARAAARQPEGRASLRATLLTTARNTIIHPVVLPVLVGLAWNLTGVEIPQALDQILLMLGQAVVPVCLIAIGMSLAHYGLQGSVRGAIGLTLAKLVVQPALVLLVGRYVFGLSGLPLTVIVMCAGLPSGTNALMFSQRYATQEAETTATIVLSTLVFALSAPVWLWLVSVVALR